MNEELEALAILKQTIFHYTLGCLTTEEEKAFKIIKTALKKYEVLQEVHKDFVDKNINKLKALEIIRDKEPSIMRIRLTRNSEHFNAIMPETRRLTQEEYDLVKEVLS